MMQSGLNRFFEIGRKIICVGRNYVEHAAELGNQVPTAPILFMKPTTSYIVEGQPIKIPRSCKELHHEIELGVVIGKTGCDISESKAMDYVGGYVLALDMTARSLQDDLKKRGYPWEIAKAFDTSCPVGRFIPKDEVSDPHKVRIWCSVNDQKRQDADTSLMIFSIPKLLAYASQYFTLQEGDLVLTGTPAGVGPVKAGDVITAGIDDRYVMKFNVEQRK